MAVVMAVTARACPFCSAVSLTFTQEIEQSQVAVIVRLVEPPAAAALKPQADGPLPKGKFRVEQVLKGENLVADAGHAGPEGAPIEAIMLDDKPVGDRFLLFGIEPPKLVWSSPIKVSDRAVAYLRKLASLPAKGPDRLAFFQEHLEDADDTLARDAYDEFAVAPYEDVRGLKGRMDPARLLAWIENPKVQANRRRLYATMLGVCGGGPEAERIRLIIEGLDRDGRKVAPEQAEVRAGLDALIACYVTLAGPEALDLVDRLFLERRGRDIPFADTYAAVMAVRFLGEESTTVSRERLRQSLRLLLEEPKLADLVVADLARWEDWSVIPKLVAIFKEAKEDNIFVREPVVNFLRACPLPEAAAAVEELEKIDPEAVRRAATLAGLTGALAPAPAATDDTGPADKPAGEPAATSSSAETEDDNSGSTLPPAPTPPGGLEEDAALARQVPPVKADEEPTDGAADPPAQASVPPRTDKRLLWLVWALAVAGVAIISRAALRSRGAGAVAR
ncbi:MAG: hypothetical protein ACK6CT_14995 [Planctomycetia bacterium]